MITEWQPFETAPKDGPILVRAGGVHDDEGITWYEVIYWHISHSGGCWFNVEGYTLQQWDEWHPIPGESYDN